jgi:heme exporter protein C
MFSTKQKIDVERQPLLVKKKRKRLPQVHLVSLIIGLSSFLGMMISLWMIFFYAPTDALQGNVQRILYFHVPIAWIGMFAFVVLAFAGCMYLWKNDERWDWIASASAEIGAIFTTLMLLTGAIWGKPIWGTWWSWDPKLTAALILWFMYVGYFLLRNALGPTSASARAGAVLGLVGVIDVPIIYEAATWWRTLHPAPQVPNGLPNTALQTLLVALTSFTLLYVFLMVQLYQLGKIQTHVRRLRLSLEDS